MKVATSFRQTFRHIPSPYRTPSPPPRETIEPAVSPSLESARNNWLPEQTAHATHGLGLSLGILDGSQTDVTYEQQLWVDGDGQARIDSFNSNVIRSRTARRNTYDDHRLASRKDESPKRDRRGHSRSGSSIDALATIALATSPTFSQGSPSFSQSPWPTYSHSNGYQHDYTLDERPSKRARSERLPSPQMERRQSRPSTSYVTSLESMRNDAELLLNFAQPHNFPPLRRATPPQRSQIEHESPSYKRLSVSTAASEQTELPTHSGIHQDNYETQLSSGEPIPSKQTEGNNAQSVVAHEGESIGQKREEDTVMEDVVGLNNGSAEDKTEAQIPTTVQEPPSVSATGVTNTEEKKPRRIQPTTQAPCAKCNSLQATVGSEEANGQTSWIGCNGCQRWLHIVCAGFKDSREVRTVDKYICPDCEPDKGPTTYVRKSSRARTAIDYAGLNQGMIQSSEETAEHHWLKPIKDGRIKFQSDDFARIRPELLTMDYLEKTDGMKRPVVIPACWNPQFGVQRAVERRVGNGAATSEQKEIIDSNGDEVTAMESDPCLDDQEEVFDCGQDFLDMVMPQNLTVRRVAELHGIDMPLDVIDVKSQQTAQKWNLKKWADYYESTGEKTIRNVISLEVSQSKLGRLLQRPKIVRDLDLQDAVWPLDLPSKAVQFYCLMSVADCYTDFHIDFGGSSVYYHILKGRKTFFFIPPEEKHLKKYEQWNNSPLQNQTFLGNMTGDCSRVDLGEGDTMLIPSGWIHAVWTPENSLVIGGNFLTRMSYEMQIKVNRIEIDTKTALKFRYPLFQKVNWYAAIRYLEDDPVPEEVLDEFEDDPDYLFLRANPVWHEFGDLENDAEPGDAFYNARFYSRMEIEGLPALRDYLYRTALIASDFHVDGVTETARTNVKKSIPKGHGEPMDLIRKFGIWVAWKTGCVKAPEWVRPNSPSLSSLARKADKEKKSDVLRTPGERMSSRVQSQLEHARTETVNTMAQSQASSAEPEVAKEEIRRPRRIQRSSAFGTQRFACDSCRKRRIRCRHREAEVLSPSNEAGAATIPPSITGEIPRSVPAPSSANFDEPPSPSLAKPSDPSKNPQSTSTSLPLQEVNCLNSQSTPLLTQTQELAVAGGSSGKKGRSKACDECRKSKRRCIHDENGKVDPFKAAEPSKPRGSTSSKRPARLVDEAHPPPPAAEKSKADEAGNDTILVDQAHTAVTETFNEATVEDDGFDALIDPSLRPAIRQLQAATEVMAQSAHEMNEAAGLDPNTDDLTADELVVAPCQAKLTVQVDIKPQKFPSLKTELHQAVHTTSSSQISANTMASPPESLHNDSSSHQIDHHPDVERSVEMNGEGISNDSTSNPLQTPKSAVSRHSSRQPKPVDRYVPEISGSWNTDKEIGTKGASSASGTSNNPAARGKKERRRASSSGAATSTPDANGNTDGGGKAKSRRASSHITSSNAAAVPVSIMTSSSPKSGFLPRVSDGQQQQATFSFSSSASSPLTSSPTTSSSVLGIAAETGTMTQAKPQTDTNHCNSPSEQQGEAQADEESLKLIRTLHEEDFGLRKRRSLKA